jgi:beta-glucuronidase
VRRIVAACAALLAFGARVCASAAGAADDFGRPLYQDGPTGRYLLTGTWLRRRDLADRGLGQRWHNRRSAAGRTPVSIPDTWNAGDTSMDPFIGRPVWYRKELTLPQASPRLGCRLRFEAVNYRAQVWLNGRLLGEHAGGYLPFEVPLTGLNRTGVNRLVVRVDNRRLPTDFPPSIYTSTDEPLGGWWNWGGIVREVYLRRVDRRDFERVQVRPGLGCPGRPATVSLAVALRNDSDAAQRVRLRGTFGTLPVAFREVTIPRGVTRTLTKRLSVPQPHLWRPSDPFLYRVALDASVAAVHGRFMAAAGYRLHAGIRTVSVSPDGRLLLNGAPVNLRGVSVHEDVPGKGAALRPADRADLVARIKNLGATLVRAHYPPHPAFQELVDREGQLTWSEVPVYRMVAGYLAAASVRRAAVDEVRQDILTNENRASVIVWSVGNELAPAMPYPVRAFVASAAGVARALDPSRPVGVATQGVPRFACRAGYGPLDVIGMNDYFGWYGADITNRDDLSPYLDRMRACHPTKAVP